ncbi:trypsin-like serine peptidase [Primorskyibacter marinus]|uniref:trypsin-like serine peptidase n=1 Tax=Primorskyibacter marinus TaxID=1977320 RepID=UPI000E30A29A|nr:trypsin-like serine protease [Primorskyibacter marinus]
MDNATQPNTPVRRDAAVRDAMLARQKAMCRVDDPATAPIDRRASGLTGQTRMGFWAAMILALGLGAQAQAELPALPLEDHAAWQAVGRVNQAGFNQKALCSGTLIAPDLVLTAAHCVQGRDGLIPLGRLHFVAGWLGGEYADDAGARRVLVHPDYADKPGPSDIALMWLDHPLEVTPFALHAPQPGIAAIMGYQDNRPHRLGARFDCQRLSDTQLWLSCPARRGTSGGPVLQQVGGIWHLVGVVNGTNSTASVGAPVGNWVLAHMTDRP